eukprot:gene16543-22586_t
MSSIDMAIFNQRISTEDIPVSHNEIIQLDGFTRILEIERAIAIIGAIGAGKTTLVGSMIGDTNKQCIGLLSQTKEVQASKFTQYYRRPDGTYYGINFTIYDTYGFNGNPLNDIWELHKLMDEICDNFPCLHAIIFCVTAIRLHKSGDNILRMFSVLGGSVIKSRMKFVITNAPTKTVHQPPKHGKKPFLIETKEILENIMGGPIKDTDIMTSNLIDPNQFELDDPQYAATRQTWLHYQQQFSTWIKDIQDPPIKVNRISIWWRIYSIVHIYFYQIMFTIVILLLFALFFQNMNDIAKMREILKENQQLREKGGLWRGTVSLIQDSYGSGIRAISENYKSASQFAQENFGSFF